MDLRNCAECRKLYVFNKNPICPECIQKDNDQFELVRKYLRKNPISHMDVVSKDTGVSVRKINKFISEGRITVTEGLSDEYRCSICKKEILRGKICYNCMKGMENRFDNTPKESVKKNVLKMHTRD